MKICVFLLIVFVWASCDSYSQDKSKTANIGNAVKTDSTQKKSTTADESEKANPHNDLVDPITKIIASLTALILAIFNIRQSSVKRNLLQKDIEILEKLEKDSASYLSVKAQIDKSIGNLYDVNGNGKTIKSLKDLIFGLACLVGFLCMFIIMIFHQFLWWYLLLSIIFLFLASGGILNAFGKDDPL
jgi:hypothetical protein